MRFHQIILCSTLLFSVFLTFFVSAQVSIPQVFQTSDNFDLFVKSIANESKNELSDESKQSILFCLHSMNRANLNQSLWNIPKESNALFSVYPGMNL
jgi:hypothetical protein